MRPQSSLYCLVELEPEVGPEPAGLLGLGGLQRPLAGELVAAVEAGSAAREQRLHGAGVRHHPPEPGTQVLQPSQLGPHRVTHKCYCCLGGGKVGVFILDSCLPCGIYRQV